MVQSRRTSSCSIYIDFAPRQGRSKKKLALFPNPIDVIVFVLQGKKYARPLDAPPGTIGFANAAVISAFILQL